MSEERTRVDFNAPSSLVEEADTVAQLLDTSRTSLLVDALRQQLHEIAGDETFQRRLREAYYDGRLAFDRLETVVGTEEATRIRLLGEALDREPPVPDRGDIEMPSEEEFYDGELPEWTPDGEESDDDDDDGFPTRT